MAFFIRFSILVVMLLIQACTASESGVEGQFVFDQQPLEQARVEFYLKSGNERSSAPFSVVTSDAEGRFRAVLPPGNYYLVGKKKEQGGGLNRMLMAEYAQNPIVVKSGFTDIKTMQLREVGFEGAISADGKTSATGQLLADETPLADAFVYVYTRGDALTGPAYGQVVRADEKGQFTLSLSAGTYWLAARKRNDGSRVGDPQAGDLNGVYPENPLVLVAGEQKQLKPWSLETVSSAAKQRRLEQGKFTATSTWLSGRVVDEDKMPVAGIYLFAYRDNRMIGKPNYISTPTTADGTFQIYLEDGGEYFVGARSTFGGPLEPGEWVGTYDKRADHGVEAVSGQANELGDILVREVW